MSENDFEAVLNPEQIPRPSKLILSYSEKGLIFNRHVSAELMNEINANFPDYLNRLKEQNVSESLIRKLLTNIYCLTPTQTNKAIQSLAQFFENQLNPPPQPNQYISLPSSLLVEPPQFSRSGSWLKERIWEQRVGEKLFGDSYSQRFFSSRRPDKVFVFDDGLFYSSGNSISLYLIDRVQRDYPRPSPTYPAESVTICIIGATNQAIHEIELQGVHTLRFFSLPTYGEIFSPEELAEMTALSDNYQFLNLDPNDSYYPESKEHEMFKLHHLSPVLFDYGNSLVKVPGAFPWFFKNWPRSSSSRPTLINLNNFGNPSKDTWSPSV
jgi:hypothetical protein